MLWVLQQMRRVTLVMVATVLLLAGIHGVCEAAKHGHGVSDALALCAAVVAAASLLLIGGTRRRESVLLREVFPPVAPVMPSSARTGGRTSPVWLQRFQN